MDRFTRNYSIGLGTLALALAAIWVYSSWSPRVWEINALLESDPTIAAYPYQFRVRSLKDGVATISTPRSFDVPTIQFLGILYPGLAKLDQDDPRMVAAERKLIDVQKRAMGLVEAQPDVKQVSWALDVRWLADRGVVAQKAAP
jgi:hypothetical protein